MSKKILYCKGCGEQLVEVKKVATSYDINTGKPHYCHYFECPNYRKQNLFEALLAINSKHTSTFLFEEEMGESNFPDMNKGIYCNHCATLNREPGSNCFRCGAPLQVGLS